MLTVDYKRLLSALFLTNVFTLQRQTQRKAMKKYKNTNFDNLIKKHPVIKSSSLWGNRLYRMFGNFKDETVKLYSTAQEFGPSMTVFFLQNYEHFLKHEQ